jgi:hypothetical protein
MKHKLLFHFHLLHHYFLSRSKFDIHSPFVYKIYSEILKDKTDYPEHHTLIKTTSEGNRSLFNKDYRLLFRLSRYFKPKTILILGTKDETSVSYLSSGFPESLVISGFDSPALIAYPGVFDMVFVLGDLPGNDVPDYFSLVMQHIHNDSVLIFCNIYGSKKMQEVWNKIKNHTSVTLTIDLFNLGLVFCKEELTKEDFILRY